MALSVPSSATVSRVRVLVVDDSAVIRGLLARTLEADPEIEVVASIPDGRAAIAAVSRMPVDVVLLDVEMPVMGGLAAIPLLLKAAPGVKIVMASTLTAKNAQVTLDALAAGAVDYVLKPSATRALLDSTSFNRELLAKVRQLGAHRLGAHPAPTDNAPQPLAPTSPRPVALRAPPKLAPAILAIGSSTGGPPALFQVLKQLSSPPRIPILIVQHMPPTFTGILAAHISRQCGVAAVEATDGSALEPGRVYVAPGNFHMTIDAARVIRLNQGPPENYCRPSVNPTLRSLATVYGGRVLATILTGMGSDGLEGCRAVVEAGGAVIAQDKATSVVWGMPGAVAMAGLCSAVLPLAEIGPQLQAYLVKRP
jgi:two-component system, chemotaxis family, protein-glutamate methylesterase/glutaminase